MPLLSRRLLSYFPNAISNRDFSFDLLSFLSVATETVYKARGSYQIRQEVGAPCSLPSFSPRLSLVSSRRRRFVLALAVTRVVVVLSSRLSLVPLLVLLVTSRPYLEPLPVLPTTVALWSSTL